MNLFALELNDLLTKRNLFISSLFSLRAPDGTAVVPPAKVARLQRALTEDIVVILGDQEISDLAFLLKLSAEEERRLRSAIMGEAVHRMLAGRVSRLSALDLGRSVVDLLMKEGEDEETLRSELRHATRHTQTNASYASADINAVVARGLETAADAAEQGELWLGVALETTKGDHRLDLLQLARITLDRAARLLALAPSLAQGTPIQAEWRRTIERALATLRKADPSQHQ